MTSNSFEGQPQPTWPMGPPRRQPGAAEVAPAAAVARIAPSSAVLVLAATVVFALGLEGALI